MSSGKLNSIQKPPVFTDVTDWAFKKWVDDVYTEFVKNSQPDQTITTTGTRLGLDFFYAVDATSAAITVNLPKASEAKNKKYIIKKIDSSIHVVTISAQGTDKIDGASTSTLSAQWDATLLQSDGISHWYVLAGAAGGSGTVTSVTAADETIIIGGTATDVTVRANTTDDVVASEALTAGMLVNVFDSSGVAKARKADCSLGQSYRCDGFVVDTVALGATVRVYYIGRNSHCTGLVAGDVWLGTAGLPTQTPPTTTGYISQKVGTASSSTELEFNPSEDILIAATHAVGTGGTTQSTVITTNTTITIGTGGAWVSMIGGGGAGAGSANAAASGGGGGGAGEYCQNFIIPFTSGETVTFVVGAGGIGTLGGAGGDGGDTYISCLAGTFLVKGGKGAPSSTSGAGGGPKGASGVAANNPGAAGVMGTLESPVHYGGSSGGSGGNGVNITGGKGGAAPGNLGVAGTGGNANGGGGGSGASTVWGSGAVGGTGNANGVAAAANTGAGGGGAGGNNGTGGQTGGNGGSGMIYLIYTA